MAEKVLSIVHEYVNRSVSLKYTPIAEQEIEIQNLLISGMRAFDDLGFVAKVSFDIGVRRLIESLDLSRAPAFRESV